MVALAILNLATTDEEAWAGNIHQYLLGKGPETPSPGAVYLALEDLEDKNYVESWIEDRDYGQGGRPRKYYRVNEAGKGALQKTLESLCNMAGDAVTFAPGLVMVK